MDGIVLINKEKGISSFGVVAKVRRIFNTKKVGHCGTLDPEATGVLPIMVGKATKVSKYLVEHDKEYIATLKLGVKTDSGDGEGNIIKTDNFKLEESLKDEYLKKINNLVGIQEQIPPMYSAIKVNGKKLYEYARNGIEVERNPRRINIYSIFVETFKIKENEIVFKVNCSKGTYIRTLCENMAEALGTVGYMKELKRTKVDNFTIEDSITLTELEKLQDKEKIVISIEDLFNESEKIDLNDTKNQLFLNGVMLAQNVLDGIYRIYNGENFIGLGIVKDKKLKRDVIL